MHHAKGPARPPQERRTLKRGRRTRIPLQVGSCRNPERLRLCVSKQMGASPCAVPHPHHQTLLARCCIMHLDARQSVSGGWSARASPRWQFQISFARPLLLKVTQNSHTGGDLVEPHDWNFLADLTIPLHVRPRVGREPNSVHPDGSSQQSVDGAIASVDESVNTGWEEGSSVRDLGNYWRGRRQ